MKIAIAILLTIIAGFMNGSYAFPVKHMQKWPNETIWMIFSIIGFVIIPWSTLFILDHNIFTLFNLLPMKTLSLLFIGGLIFGLGMILFTFSLRYIGIGVSFLLNIAAGTVFASLLPIFIMVPAEIFKSYGLLEIAAMLLFIVGIVASGYALKFRNTSTATSQNKNLGFILGILSGLLTSAQGFIYALTIPTIRATLAPQHFSVLVISNAPWLVIFSAAFIPYFFYFLVTNVKNKNLRLLSKLELSHYYIYLVVMGIFYFISLIVFSQASMTLGNLGTVIAWPMFMIFIILTSNFWSYIQGEWNHANSKAYLYGLISLLSFIIAVILLGTNAYLNVG